jgi:hypothetical protein
MTAVQKPNISDLISLICNLRKEAYGFERHLALLTFGLWMTEPNDLAFLKHGRLIGAAQIVRSIGKAQLASASWKRFIEREFSSDCVTTALISPPIIGPLKDEIEARQSEADLVRGIVETLLSAPTPKDPARRPSLNKAMHFILNGGFGPDYKASPATIKRQWVRYVTTTPFLLAEEEMNLGIIAVAPDADIWLRSINKLLQKPYLLREYFGVTLGIQNALIFKLDPVSRRRFHFVTIPAEIEQIECEYQPFNAEQQKIYDSYRAPRYSKHN